VISIPPSEEKCALTKKGKIIFGVAAGILGLCLVISVVVILFIRGLRDNIAASIDYKIDPTLAASTANEIVDFKPARGYFPASTMKIPGYGMLVDYAYSDSAENKMVLLQILDHKEINENTVVILQEMINQYSKNNLMNLQTIDARMVDVRSKPAQVIINEGVNAENVNCRQIWVAFEGKSGTVMLMVLGPSQGWDQKAYDAMIASIR